MTIEEDINIEQTLIEQFNLKLPIQLPNIFTQEHIIFTTQRSFEFVDGCNFNLGAKIVAPNLHKWTT